MGVIKSAAGSIGGVLADQWKEFYLCNSLSSSTLVKKVPKTQTDRGANTEGDPNVVSDGSCIVVNEGQCGLVVDGGEVIGEFPEPGEQIFHTDRSPSLFGGSGLGAVFRDMGCRFTFGGDVPQWQAVYYVNTKELPGPELILENPIPFRFRDPVTGLDLDGGAVCRVHFTYRISDPALFFRKVSGAVSDRYPASRLESQLDSELRSALQQSLGDLAGQGFRPSQMGGQVPLLTEALTKALDSLWLPTRGLQVVSLAIYGLSAAEGPEIRSLQLNAVLRDPTMAAAALVSAAGESLKTAAENPGGAAVPLVAAASDTWRCVCGRLNDRNFCPDCGRRRP